MVVGEADGGVRPLPQTPQDLKKDIYFCVEVIKVYLLAVNVHVFSVCCTFPQPRPVLAVLVKILAKVANVTSNGAVGQHPARVTAAL